MRFWRTATAGEPAPAFGAVVMDPDLDGATPVLFGRTTPDVVRLPDEHGGAVVRVTGEGWHRCPVPDHDHVVRWFDLAGEVVVAVAECPVAGFCFMGRP